MTVYEMFVTLKKIRGPKVSAMDLENRATYNEPSELPLYLAQRPRKAVRFYLEL